MATDLANTDSSTQINTRLHGRWLFAARVAWGTLFVLTIVILIIGLPVLYNSTRNMPEFEQSVAQYGLSLDSFAVVYMALTTVPMLVFVITALALFLLRSDDWMVMFVSLTPLMFWMALTAPTATELKRIYAGWYLLILPMLVMGGISLFLLFYLFPNGRFVPRWTRIPAVVVIIVWLVTLVSPDFPQLAHVFDILVPILLLAFVGIGVFAQSYRYVRVSTPIERQQTKWPLLSLLLFVATLGLFAMVDLVFDHIVVTMTGMAVIVVAGLFVPVSFGFSVLRYRLWDIDFIINRSLVYGALTALLILLFGFSTFAISQVFSDFEGGAIVAVAVSAAIFGAVFRPTRRWLQRFVDRRFYDIQIDYQKTPVAVPVPGQMTAVIQQTRFGAYQNLEFVGRGGMAEIYKAIHPTLGHPVAIKLLPAHLATDPDFRHRFLREAQVVTELDHPNIVRVFDFGEEGDAHYIVMEFLSGEDLAHHLCEVGHLSPAQAAPILQNIAAALDYAHTRGVVHRDIKPSNVMLDRADPRSEKNTSTRAVLVDFGIAKIVGGHTMLTRTGMLGTLDYVAPEQIQASAEVDRRADVYALGVMVYQMLTGELPFKHDNPGALLIAHLTQPPPNAREYVPELSRHIAHALQCAMAKGPLERYSTAGEFIRDLLA